MTSEPRASSCWSRRPIPAADCCRTERRTGKPSTHESPSWSAELNAERLGPSGYGPVGAVVGATYPEQLAEMRAAMPTSWILVPGFGAQGGGAADVMGGLDDDGIGRGRQQFAAHHLRPLRQEFRDRFGEARWQDAVAAATREMNQQLQEARPSV